ncbi:KTSC domain-containing protein [Flavobacterium soyangense]|uniref:KTSC domain-containing protein n=1 Tax=Flavobacterium soyangense TaxID=2023265 RepID=A0A930Y1C8_9FLAO|nr:KTSC domain-containing protein [Flavobacterium soyangense]MBF2709339.1 KTSC domain-containing protein [Flavobacterium soyangense]
MKKIISLLAFFTIISCGNKCDEIPNSFNSYDQAKEVVLSSNFKLTDKADVSGSSWITSAKYFSCDGLSGFFIVETGNRTYIHQNMPYEVWENFKNADSKGSFYSRNIRGNYQLKLNH